MNLMTTELILVTMARMNELKEIGNHDHVYVVHVPACRTSVDTDDGDCDFCDGSFDEVDHQAKEEESRGKIGNNLDEEKSKAVQGMVNRLTFLIWVVEMIVKMMLMKRQLTMIANQDYCQR